MVVPVGSKSYHGVSTPDQDGVRDRSGYPGPEVETERRNELLRFKFQLLLCKKVILLAAFVLFYHADVRS